MMMFRMDIQWMDIKVGFMCVLRDNVLSLRTKIRVGEMGIQI